MMQKQTEISLPRLLVASVVSVVFVVAMCFVFITMATINDNSQDMSYRKIKEAYGVVLYVDYSSDMTTYTIEAELENNEKTYGYFEINGKEYAKGETVHVCYVEYTNYPIIETERRFYDYDSDEMCNNTTKVKEKKDRTNDIRLIRYSIYALVVTLIVAYMYYKKEQNSNSRKY